MRRRRKSPLRAVLQGLLAGLLGNAVFTAYQRLIRGEDDRRPKDWSETPEPAQVGQRVAEGVFERHVPLDKADFLANLVHWSYGTGWGAVYAVVEESLDNPLASGAALATAVVAADYTLLPLMNLYKPPWRYPVGTLAKDYRDHLVYGLAVAGAYRSLERMHR